MSPATALRALTKVRVVDMQLYPQVRPQWDALTHTTFEELESACRTVASRFDALSIASGLMLILNPDFLKREENVRRFKAWSQQERLPLAFGCLLDFRDPSASTLLVQACQLGFTTLKLYPYLQGIEDREFPDVAILAREAEALGMFLTVCCSYGTRVLDRYSGVRLCAYLSEQVTCPIIMAHAGGAKVIDAMLAAEAAENLFLDLSFSLPYYRGSSLEQDFAFAIRKLGTHRWLYGSDAPFVDLESSLHCALEFFDRHGFSASDAEQVLYKTAERILHG